MSAQFCLNLIFHLEAFQMRFAANKAVHSVIGCYATSPSRTFQLSIMINFHELLYSYFLHIYTHLF